MELNKELIEKALALTWKTMGDMWEMIWWDFDYGDTYYFSYPKFFAYLLSSEFIEKYYYEADMSSEWYSLYPISWLFWHWIYCYQSWNPEPLEDLLYKI